MFLQVNFLVLFLCSTILARSSNRLFTIMIDPAGDAQYPGRVIDGSFERGLTLQFAEELKERLENKYTGIRVILTRFSGETVEPLQNAMFANRLNVDIYLSIHFYHQKQNLSTIYIYQLLYNPATDFWQRITHPLSFIPVNKAYLINSAQAKKLGTILQKSLREQEKRLEYTCKDLLGIPFKPLIGIRAPALGIEIGLKNKEDWQRFIEPIFNGAALLIQVLYNAK